MLIWLVLVLVEDGGAKRAGQARHRDVVTTQGTVRGYLTSGDIYAYLGIPYARPPTLFKAPEPPPSWDGIFEATHRVRCPQLGTGSDNCLVVNVFTPEHASSLPVLVYVHAGGFQAGWGPHYPPTRLLREDIVVVTINYRLGVRGFLCLDTLGTTGNIGLKDQVAALYWIQRNIANFGGNPHSITIYGTEAGAISIQILLLSGITEGLFHKVILESGSVLSPLAMTHKPIALAMNAAIKLGYTKEENTHKLLQFYEKLNSKYLLTVSELFLPCIENESYYSPSLLNRDPRTLLLQGNFQKVPMLITYPNTDNSINNDTFDIFVENFDQLLPNNLEFGSNTTRHQIAELVKGFYFENDYTDSAQQFAKYIHDVIIEYPIIKFAFHYAMKNSYPVFLMRFDNISIKTINIFHNYRNIFDYIYPKQIADHSIDKTMEILLTLWTNFIKLGDPTPITTQLIPVIWQPAAPEEIDQRIDIRKLKEIVIGTSMRMAEPASSQYVTFWDHIYSKFYKSYKKQNDTYDELE